MDTGAVSVVGPLIDPEVELVTFPAELDDTADEADEADEADRAVVDAVLAADVAGSEDEVGFCWDGTATATPGVAIMLHPRAARRSHPARLDRASPL